MNFRLSPELDKNKVFLVKFRELDGRFDPIFYSSNINKFNWGKYESLKIQSIAKKLISGVGVGKQDQGTDIEGVIQIRPTNITKDGILKYDKNIFLPKLFQGPKINIDDILFNNTNSQDLVGKTSILKEERELFFSNHITKIEVDKNKVIPDYLSIVLNTYQRNKIFYSICTNWNNQSGIGSDLLRSLKIPIPPKKIQAQIVAEMDAAYATKNRKETEVQRLLDSIDDYLLGELGIKLPEQKKNTIQSRMFTRKISEVSGGRFDAPVHQEKYSLETAKFPMEKFSNCLFINPSIPFFGFSLDTLATFIPMVKVFDQYGTADTSDYRTITESGGYTKFQDNDLLWAKITPCMQNGKSAVVSGLKNGIGFGSTEFHVFRTKPEIDIGYIHALLRLRSLRNHAVLYFSGSAGHQRVSDKFFKTLCIPKPPLKKQTEIANHIDEIRNQAKQLREEAKKEVERAKKEVETMILGEDESKT